MGVEKLKKAPNKLPMNNPILTLALVVALTSFAGTSKAENLLQNGNFDNGLSGWSYSGQIITSSYYDSSTVYNPSNWSYPWVSIQAPYGSFTANQFAQFGSPNNGGGENVLSQSFNTVTGNAYTVSFYANGRTDRGRDYFRASIGTINFVNQGAYNDMGSGVVINGLEGWAKYSTDFIATDAITTLKFTNQNIDSAYGVGMVSVTSVPEPSSLSLCAVGLGGLAMMRRRRS